MPARAPPGRAPLAPAGAAPRPRRLPALPSLLPLLLPARACGGAAACWSDVFQFEQCCALRLPRGHADCWVGTHSYEGCCSHWRSPPPAARRSSAAGQARNSVRFWRGLLARGQLDEQASPDFRLRREVEQVLLSYPTVAAACDAGEALEVPLLDVGSGPLTVLGRAWPTCPSLSLRVVQLDPLAGPYRRLLRAFGVPEPALVNGTGEALPFGDGAFALVHARNSVDHAEDPVRVIREMLRASQQTVFLEHYRNEGWHGLYWGWHHWNFDVDYQRHLVLWGRDGSRVDITRYLEGYADVHVDVVSRGLRAEVGIPGIRSREVVYAVIAKRGHAVLGGAA